MATAGGHHRGRQCAADWSLRAYLHKIWSLCLHDGQATSEAARLSGINTQKIVASCLAISGFSAGLAGMLNTGRLGSAQGYGLEDMLLDSISAVVLGGTSLFGGEGGVKNTLVGLLIFGVLSNGLNQLQLDIYVRLSVHGVILLIALIINIYALRLHRPRGMTEDNIPGVGRDRYGYTEATRPTPGMRANAQHRTVRLPKSPAKS